MTTAGLRGQSAIGPPTDVGAMWNAAIDRYEKNTNVKISSLYRTNDMDQIITEIQKNEADFEKHRHDGSKFDKFRTVVKNSLNPIQTVGEIVAQATKAVREMPLPLISHGNLRVWLSRYILPAKPSLRLFAISLVYELLDSYAVIVDLL